MKYQPSLPEHNDNVSHSKPLREFLLVLCALTVLALSLFWMAGLAVDWAVERMSPQMEARIHRALAASIPRQKPEDPALQAHLQQMLDRLAPCADLPYPVTLQLEQSDLPNAFVMPGAHIVVYTGLQEKLQSENGLSFVLAHELAHLQQRDHLRSMGRSLLLVAVSTLLTGAHSDLTQILVPANQFGAARHSQARELTADGRALDILHCRYGHAGGATELFRSLQQETPASIGVSHYFASHPRLRERIANLERLIQKKGYAIGSPSPKMAVP